MKNDVCEANVDLAMTTGAVPWEAHRRLGTLALGHRLGGLTGWQLVPPRAAGDPWQYRCQWRPLAIPVPPDASVAPFPLANCP